MRNAIEESEDEDDFEDNKYLPKVEIVDFKVFNKSVKILPDLLDLKKGC